MCIWACAVEIAPWWALGPIYEAFHAISVVFLLTKMFQLNGVHQYGAAAYKETINHCLISLSTRTIEYYMLLLYASWCCFFKVVMDNCGSIYQISLMTFYKAHQWKWSESIKPRYPLVRSKNINLPNVYLVRSYFLVLKRVPLDNFKFDFVFFLYLLN